jgi:hypothetical protein
MKIIFYRSGKDKWYTSMAACVICRAPIQRKSQFKENHTMALRSKMMTKELDQEEPAQELFSQRRKPDVGQFRLQVDRQTKASFTTLEAAEAAGMVIKKGHPVVRVSVYDAVECVNRIIELPQT